MLSGEGSSGEGSGLNNQHTKLGEGECNPLVMRRVGWGTIMEKTITIIIRFIALAFILQPIVVVAVLFEGLKQNPSVPLFISIVIGVSFLASVGVGVAVWRYAPEFFIGIFKRLRGR